MCNLESKITLTCTQGLKIACLLLSLLLLCWPGLGSLHVHAQSLDTLPAFFSPVLENYSLSPENDLFGSTISSNNESTITQPTVASSGLDQASPALSKPPPIWLTLPENGTQIFEQEVYSFDVQAQSTPPSTINYSLDQASVDAGMVLDQSTGAFSWTPKESQGPDAYEITFIATDADGLTQDSTVTLSVLEVNLAPILDTIPDVNGYLGESISLLVTASDPDTLAPSPFTFNSMIYTLDQSSQDIGMTINPFSGEFNWTPMDEGTFLVTLIVTDDGDPTLSDSQSFSVIIFNGAAFTFIVPPTMSVDELQPLETTVGAEVVSAKYTIDLASYDQGMSMDPQTGEFYWVPAENQGPGSYSVTFTATDTTNGFYRNAESVIVVNEVNESPILSIVENQEVQIGTNLNIPLEAIDTDIPTNILSFSLDQASLDAGMKVDDATNAFTWTPTEVGNYPVTITVTDNGIPALSTDQRFTIKTVSEVSGDIDFVLIDAVNDEAIQDISQDEVFDLIDLEVEGFNPRQLNIQIRPDSFDGVITSIRTDVLFESVSGDVSSEAFVDSTSRYSVYGDDNAGDFDGVLITPGKYELISSVQRDNAPIVKNTIRFEVIGPRISSYTLINAELNEPVPKFDPIALDTSIQIFELGLEQINIVANTVDFKDPLIESVQFSLKYNDDSDLFITGRIENYRPYTVFGDEDLGGPVFRDIDRPEDVNYLFWPRPENGRYELLASVFSEDWPTENILQQVPSFLFSLGDEVSEVNPVILPPAIQTEVKLLGESTQSNGIDPRSEERTRIYDAGTDHTEISLSFVSNRGHRITNGEIEFTTTTIRGDTTITSVQREGTISENAQTFSATIPIDSIFSEPYEIGRFTVGSRLDFSIADTTFKDVFTPLRDTLTFIGPRIESFSLIDGNTDTLIPGFDPIPEDTTIDLSTLTTNLKFRPNIIDPNRSIKRLEVEVRDAQTNTLIRDPFEILINNLISGPLGDLGPGISDPQAFECRTSSLPVGQLMLAGKWSYGEAFGSPFAQHQTSFIADEPPCIMSGEVKHPLSLRMGIPDTLSALITDNNSLVEQKLHFRPAGFTDTLIVSMRAGSVEDPSRFSVEIPEFIKALNRSLEVFITATDNRNLTTRYPAQGVISIPSEINEQAVQVEGGTAKTAFRLFTVPLFLRDSTVTSVLKDLGPFDDTRWRLFEPGGDSPVELGPSETPFAPGKAFWLIVEDADKTIDPGPGTTVPTGDAFAIPLKRGWNYIGNPFNFDIPVSNLSLASQDTFEIQSYEGAWMPPDTLEPYKGYAVMKTDMAVGEEQTLFISPTQETSSKKQDASKLASKNANNAWNIQIQAQSQEARDTYTVAGVRPEAAFEWDQLDRPEPPSIGGYVSVYFSHPEWGLHPTRFTTDMRPMVDSEGHDWDFFVESNTNDAVRLTFSGIDTIAESQEVWLVDQLLGVTQNLRERPHYTLSASEDARALKLLVGSKSFVDIEQALIEKPPLQYELFGNFPNPFQLATTIRYGIPTEDVASIVIYNMLGQEVTELEQNREVQAGYHAVVWNGTTSAGIRVPSGIYFARLKTEHFSKTIKMVVLR